MDAAEEVIVNKRPEWVTQEAILGALEEQRVKAESERLLWAAATLLGAGTLACAAWLVLA